MVGFSFEFIFLLVQFLGVCVVFVELYLLWWWFSLCLVVPLFVTLLGADVKFLDIVAGVYTVLLVDVDWCRSVFVVVLG